MEKILHNFSVALMSSECTNKDIFHMNKILKKLIEEYNYGLYKDISVFANELITKKKKKLTKSIYKTLLQN